MINLDTLIIQFDKGLRTLFANGPGQRSYPAKTIPAPPLADAERKQVAALMRVNHSGEVCAQALYQGQALTARNQPIKAALQQASNEEVDHLAWTHRRISELGGKTSLLNPLWYSGSFAIGAIAGLLGDRWNLGFLAETEHQVVQHLAGHLAKLPKNDESSRAILGQMKIDEAKHATTALSHGGAPLPLPIKIAMKISSRVMTKTSYWL